MCALGLIRRGSAAVAHVAEVAQVAQVAQVAEVAEVALSRRKEHLRPVHGGGVGGGGHSLNLVSESRNKKKWCIYHN